ncbi:MAG: ATP-binding protein [Halothiobacillaceae bacterium]|nr:MAG: ATP-binding protein [Halothiobacillaceae bacterium]
MAYDDRLADSVEGVDGNEELFSRFRHKKLGVTRSGQEVVEAPFPAAPTALEGLGVGTSLIHKLILKHLLISGALRTDELAARLAIPVSLLEEPTAFLRKEMMVEARGEGSAGISGLLRLNLSERGYQRARVYMEENTYAGPVPVPLEQYRRQIAAQTVRQQVASRRRVDEVFRHIVINPDNKTQLGAAFNSGGSIFLYGPPGTGKTFLASQLVHLLHGDVAIPHAVEVQGQIIRVFDPVNHEPVETAQAAGIGTEVDRNMQGADDARWVRCKRPVIVAGGELSLEMLDLEYHPNIGFYEAPLQMKANGGIFLIDDLGRQVAPTSAVLNRWIVPLENEVDYLSLHTGAKFQIPFDILPMFATNLDPESIADEAFLRRLGYKIHVGYVTPEEYHSIFQQYCEANGLAYSPDMVDELIEKFYRTSGRHLVACHPRDLINKVIDFSIYEGVRPSINMDMMKKAWNAYFVLED